MVQVDARLAGQQADGSLLPLALRADGSMMTADADNFTRLGNVIDRLDTVISELRVPDPTDYPAVNTVNALNAIRNLLEGVLTISGTVALDAAALAALENITVTVANQIAMPTVFPLPESQVVRTVALDSPTLTALESLTVTVSNPTPGTDTTALAREATLAAQHALLVAIRDRGTFPLPTTQIDLLRTPTTFPLPPEQITDLKTVDITQKPLIDAETGTSYTAARDTTLAGLRGEVATSARQATLQAAIDQYRTDFLAEDFATQATSESLRANFALYRGNIEARDLSTGAKQDAILTRQGDGSQITRLSDATDATRRLNINAVGAARVVISEPAGGVPAISYEQYAALRGRQGNVYSASSGRHDAGSVGSTTIKMLLRNPSTSGKTMWVYRLDAFSSAAIGFFAFLVNPTTDLPTTAKKTNNHYIGHPNISVAEAYADVGTAMTGGTDSGIVIPVPSGSFNKLRLEAPYVLSPGVSLAIQATFSAATAVIVTADWWEE